MRDASRGSDTGLFILRAVVGVIFVTHGWPKLMDGASGTAEFFGMLGIPAATASAWLITLLEVFGGIALLLGLLVPFVAVLFIVHMTVGLLLVHLPEGWYVIGPGTGGMEFNVLLIAALVTFLLAGSGKPALDAKLFGGGPAPAPTPEAGSGEAA